MYVCTYIQYRFNAMSHSCTNYPHEFELLIPCGCTHHQKLTVAFTKSCYMPPYNLTIDNVLLMDMKLHHILIRFN